MCRKCQKDISYEKQKTVKSSGRIPLATYMYVQNTCIMNTDNFENETKDNSTNSTDKNNNLINNFIDLLDELNCSTNDDHSIYMLVSESDHEDLSEILEKVFPNAPEK